MRTRLWRAAAVLALALGLVTIGSAAASAAPAAAHPVNTVTVSRNAAGELVTPAGTQRYTTSWQQRHPDVVTPDINRVNGCTDPNSYWDVRNYPPLVCFANAGSISVAIYSVYQVNTGNNAGWFEYYYGGYYYDTPNLGKWNTVNFTNFRPEVTFIQIF